MNRETRDFLDAVRTAEDPSAEDARRVLSAVRTALVTGTTLSPEIGAAKASAPTAGGVATSLKLGGLIVGLSAAAWVASTSITTGPSGSGEMPPPRPASATSRAPAVAPVSPPPPPVEATHSGSAPRVRALPATTPSARPGTTPDRPAARVAATAAPFAPPSLHDEIALLAEVQAALARGDGSTALRRLDEHTTHDRRLLAERRAARVLALCLLGRTEEAERAALVFFREHSTSVQRTAVERSCVGTAPIQR
jgi:hypothetical protein